MTDTVDDIFWNSDIHYAYGLYKLILRILGIWPFTCQNISALLLVTFACITQITMVGFIVVEAIMANSQLNPQIMSFLSCNFLSLTKVLLVRGNWRNMRYVLGHLTASWKSIDNSRALEKKKSHAKLGRTVCLCHLGGTYAVCMPIIISTLPFFVTMSNNTTNDTTQVLTSFPLQTSHLFATTSPILYGIIFIYQCVQLFFTTTGNVGNDVFFFGLAMNLTAELECLAFDLEDIDKDITENEASTRPKSFSSCIERQVRLIQMAQCLEITFSFAALSIVSLIGSQMCFYGIVVIRSARSHDIVLLTNTLVTMIILIFQIFVYSYAGDHLSAAIENLGNALYKSSWYQMPMNHRKDIIFVVMRTHKVFTFTAGKIYPMNLDSFKNIMKALGSYFSVMQAMFED